MSLMSSLREPLWPVAAIEIAASRISGASIEWRGRQAAVVSHALEPLPEGALVSSLTSPNVVDRDAVAAAVGRVLERLGSPKRIALVVPDVVAKVSLIRFERVPARRDDLEELVRWQVRKTAPFGLQDAQISFVAGQQALDGQEFIVSVARRDIIEEYERLAAAHGAHAGVVDLATFNVINAVLADPQLAAAGDWLLVNVAADYATLAILRGPHLIFFRNRAADTEGTLADLVHQTAMYYEDRLSGTGFARALLAGAAGGGRQSGDVDLIRQSLQDRLGIAVEKVDPRVAATLTDRIQAGPAFLDVLAPLVGVLVRGQEQAA